LTCEWMFLCEHVEIDEQHNKPTAHGIFDHTSIDHLPAIFHGVLFGRLLGEPGELSDLRIRAWDPHGNPVLTASIDSFSLPHDVEFAWLIANLEFEVAEPGLHGITLYIDNKKAASTSLHVNR